MRCPYCGAEVVGRKCVFCTSDLIDHIKKNGLEVDDFAEEAPAKVEEEVKQAEPEKSEKTEKKEKKKRRNKKENHDWQDAIDDIRDLCRDFLEDTRDGFGSYDARGNLTGGKEVNSRLFDILGIPKGEEVFLIHDDTLMSSGKNGFAFTERGFYAKQLFEGMSVIPYSDVHSNDVVKKSDSAIYLTTEKRFIVYHSGNKNVLEKLRILSEDILDVLLDEE